MALVGGGNVCVHEGRRDLKRKQQESGYSSTYEGNRGAGEGRAAH